MLRRFFLYALGAWLLLLALLAIASQAGATPSAITQVHALLFG